MQDAGVNVVAACSVAAALVAFAARIRPVAARSLPLASNPTDGGDVLRLLEDVERDLRTGRSLGDATLAGLRRNPLALTEVRRALESGARLGPALDSARSDRPAETVAVQTLRACDRTGGPMATAVERAVLVLRERRAWEKERHVHAAQARLSATVMTLVPLVFAGWGAATSQRVRRAYAEIPLCGVAGVVGLILNAVGWLWMRRLVTGPSA
jgi:Flp pilus assembly protein TadB